LIAERGNWLSLRVIDALWYELETMAKSQCQRQNTNLPRAANLLFEKGVQLSPGYLHYSSNFLVADPS